MTSLSETFKLAFLSNIIKNKYVGKTQPVNLGKTKGDALMLSLVNVFQMLLKEKDEMTIELTQNEYDILPITTAFIRKFSKNNDYMFDCICVMRLISVCNYFLQDNNVKGRTLKRVRKKVDYELDDLNDIRLELEDLQISTTGNQDVVEAIEKMQNNTVRELQGVQTTFASKVSKLQSGLQEAIQNASAERKREAKDLKEDLRAYVKEMMKSQTSRNRLEDTTENDNNEEKTQSLEDSISDNTRNIKDQFNGKAESIVFKNGQYEIVQDGKHYFVSVGQFANLSLGDKTYLNKKLQIDQEEVQKINDRLSELYKQTIEFINNKEQLNLETQIAYVTLITQIQEQIFKLERFGPQTQEKVEEWRKKQLEVDKAAVNKIKELQKPSITEMKNADSYDEYSDDFEAASSDMSTDERHFLEVIFDTLGMTGIDFVTDTLINYLDSGLKINKRNYKEYYKEFYQDWKFGDTKVMESDLEIVKSLFADEDINFDDDYLCIYGRDVRLSWISQMRIAVYEKYILMDFIENFQDYDIRACIHESLKNFIYDYCYMFTLMFQNVS